MADTTFNLSRADDAVAATASLQVEVIADLSVPSVLSASAVSIVR